MASKYNNGDLKQWQKKENDEQRDKRKTADEGKAKLSAC